MANRKQTQLPQLPPMMLPLLLLLMVALYSAKAKQLPQVQACGSKLNYFLHQICNGRFNRIKNNKRDSLNLYDYVDKQNEVNDDETGLVWNPSSITANRRLLRGIVDECCDRPCSLETMKLYCSY